MPHRLLAAALLVAAFSVPASAQTDTRTQYPTLLANSFFTLSLGAFDTPFTSTQLEPGFTVGTIQKRPLGVRAVLFGHEFAKHFAVQAHYARPVQYAVYRNVDGESGSHQVLMHFGGVTARSAWPLGGAVSAYGEAGIGLTSRNGFETPDGRSIMKDAHYGNWLVGGGVDYRLSPRLDLVAGVLYSPDHDEQRQPRTLFSSGGLRYTMRPLPADVVEARRRADYVFPHNTLQVDVTTDALGYGVNTLVSRKVPIFWGGNVKIDRGVALFYERNVFHTAKVFGFDIGASAGAWRSRVDREWFSTMSFYPLFRFTFLRTEPADMYFAYSLAGPSVISKTTLDGLETGHHFTFQDFLGIGWFFGKERRLNAGIKINHYSNGNIFNENAGVKIPITFSAGYNF